VPEFAAVVEEAHRQHLKVAVQAIDQSSIQTAIDANADSIEHGNDVTEEQLKLMRDKGIFVDLTPTWFDGFWTKIHETSVLSPGFRSALVTSDERRWQRAAALVHRVVKSGVKFAAWSDRCWFYPGKTRGQASAVMVANRHRAGMPSQATLFAQSGAMGRRWWQDRLPKLLSFFAFPGTCGANYATPTPSSAAEKNAAHWCLS
jgi:imidazolonepropionase-like amidohydrolase